MDNIIAAKCIINKKSPFFSVLLANAPIIECNTIPTACTDGSFIKYNPSFFALLTRTEIIGVLLHEVLHMALSHVTRGERLLNKVKANVCADFIVNQIILELLKDDKYLPSGALIDSDYAKLSMEEIYKIVPDDILPPEINLCLQPDGKQDSAIWESILEQAHISEQLHNPGNTSQTLEHILNKLKTPVVPWRELLEFYFRKTLDSHTDWTLPDRRYLATHPNIYLDVFYGETINIGVYIDSSGSVENDTLKTFYSEVVSLHTRINHGGNIEIKSFDTSVYPFDIETGKIKGRGGTCFNVVFKDVLDSDKEFTPDIIVILTDGHATIDNDLRMEVNRDVIWILDTQSNYNYFIKQFPNEISTYI